jgi:hypothetical protein
MLRSGRTLASANVSLRRWKPRCSTPVLFRKFRGEARRVTVERFPYSVVYSYDAASESIHILAIAHSRREPDYWRARQF